MPAFVIEEQQAYDRAGRPGFGARMYAKRLGRLPSGAADDAIMWGTPLGGVSDVRGPQGVTNPIVASHHESSNGHVNTFPGLRDDGTFDIDCAFYPTELAYQRQAGEFMQSFKVHPIIQDPIFGSATPMLDLFLVTTRAATSIFMCRGFLADPGYMVASLEGIMRATYRLKINGKTYQAEPATAYRQSPAEQPFGAAGTVAMELGGANPGGGFDTLVTGYSAIEDETRYVARLIIPDKYEAFSAPFTTKANHSVDSTTLVFGATEQVAVKDAYAAGDAPVVLLYRYPYPEWS